MAPQKSSMLEIYPQKIRSLFFTHFQMGVVLCGHLHSLLNLGV